MYLIKYDEITFKILGYYEENSKIELLKQNIHFKMITNDMYEYLRKLEFESDTYIKEEFISNLVLNDKENFRTRNIKNTTNTITIQSLSEENQELKKQITELWKEVDKLKTGGVVNGR